MLGRGVSKSVVLLTGDRGFESISLQERDGMGQAARLPTRESRGKVAGR
jgi:hypothetical protein